MLFKISFLPLRGLSPPFKDQLVNAFFLCVRVNCTSYARRKHKFSLCVAGDGEGAWVGAGGDGVGARGGQNLLTFEHVVNIVTTILWKVCWSSVTSGPKKNLSSLNIHFTPFIQRTNKVYLNNRLGDKKSPRYVTSLHKEYVKKVVQFSSFSSKHWSLRTEGKRVEYFH